MLESAGKFHGWGPYHSSTKLAEMCRAQRRLDRTTASQSPPPLPTHLICSILMEL